MVATHSPRHSTSRRIKSDKEQMRPKTTRGSGHESTELLATCACKRITLSVPPLATPHAHRAAHGVRARPLLSISPTRRARCLHLRCQRHAQGSDSGQSEHPNHVVHVDLTIKRLKHPPNSPHPMRAHRTTRHKHLRTTPRGESEGLKETVCSTHETHVMESDISSRQKQIRLMQGCRVDSGAARPVLGAVDQHH